MTNQHSKRIVEIQLLARGRGHVRKLILECGHVVESMKSANFHRSSGVVICETFRRKA